jgi:ribosomal protein S18 acetylase RimI-like enzyme
MIESPRPEIRRLTPDEWKIYRDLRFAALTNDAIAFGSTVERERQFGEADFRARLEQRAMFAARVGDHYVGLVGGVDFDQTGVADLISMWVAPEARRRGIGDALVRAVLDWARDQGFDQVELWVTEGNDSAERLYARHGFTRTGERQHIRPNNPDTWEVRMVLRFYSMPP